MSPPRQPEPFSPRITLNLCDDVLPLGLVDVEEGANNEDESYLQEDAKYVLIVLSAHS